MAVDRVDDDTARSAAPDTDAHDETPELSDSPGDIDNPEASVTQARPAQDQIGRADVQAEYRTYAIEQGCERVHETEETIVTPAMRRIEAEDPDRRLVGLELVSPRLRGELGNGDQFYARAGEVIDLPNRKIDRPQREFLRWHMDTVFKAS